MGFSETVHAEWQREKDRRRRIEEEARRQAADYLDRYARERREEEARRQAADYLDRYARERRLDGEGGRTYTFR